MHSRPKVPRALVFVFALAFLFETWIWDRFVAVGRRLLALVPWAALRAALARLVAPLPVWAALLLFGVPFVVTEVGALASVAITATGHVVAGAVAGGGHV